VDNVRNYEADCYNGHELMAGRWPFDASEFSRIWALNKLAFDPPPRLQNVNVLIVDTGLDFIPDPTKDPPTAPEKFIFPKSYFATTGGPETDDIRFDKNEDGIKGNFGWSGVNLAEQQRAADTSGWDNGPDRSHGLAVAALILGGSDLQRFRGFGQLPLRIGMASLSPINLSTSPVLTRTHLDNAFWYATAPGNEFRVINLSLSTRGKLPGAEEIPK
jgi:hypothetical protein